MRAERLSELLHGLELTDIKLTLRVKDEQNAATLWKKRQQVLQAIAPLGNGSALKTIQLDVQLEDGTRYAAGQQDGSRLAKTELIHHLAAKDKEYASLLQHCDQIEMNLNNALVIACETSLASEIINHLSLNRCLIYPMLRLHLNMLEIHVDGKAPLKVPFQRLLKQS
ncbi:MAG: hypothetical protein F6K19_10995 [Cyanothece sp. SIO1E1]|nr:hypothetical protein [Cyanothece sp. SIO1E1]